MALWLTSQTIEHWQANTAIWSTPLSSEQLLSRRKEMEKIHFENGSSEEEIKRIITLPMIALEKSQLEQEINGKIANVTGEKSPFSSDNAFPESFPQRVKTFIEETPDKADELKAAVMPLVERIEAYSKGIYNA